MTDPAPEQAQKHQVVVVDDDPSVRNALRRLLSVAGYQVIVYASADEFLRSPAPENHTCLVLDVQMPGLTGLELQKVLVSMQTPLPVIFITAHHDDNVRARAMEIGAVGFLEKPFDDQALLGLIRKALPQP